MSISPRRPGSLLASGLLMLASLSLVHCGKSDPEPDAGTEGSTGTGGASAPTASGPAAGQTKPVPWQVGPVSGRWIEPREGTAVERQDLSDEERRHLEELEAIGYVQGKVAGSDRAYVTLHSVEETAPGPTLITPAHAPKAYLINTGWKGPPEKPLHIWKKSFREAFPGRPTARFKKNVSYFRRTALLPDGGLLAIFEGCGIIRLDKDSNLLWANPIGAHHDLEVMPDGSVWVLTRVAGPQPQVDPDNPVLEDFVTLLDAQGEVVKSVSILKAFHQSPWAPDWSTLEKNRRGDVMHTNTLHRLDGRHADRMPEFQEGRFLLSTPMLDMIFVLDVEEEEVVWAMTGEFAFQHDPQVLDNGNIMVFDNMWQERTDPAGTKASSILEIDAVTKQVAWRYRGNKVMPFYSQTCGTAQRLPNGNTLITETDYGRAVEVDGSGKPVWEFINPFRAGDDLEYVACLMEAWRVPSDTDLDWLEK